MLSSANLLSGRKMQNRLEKSAVNPFIKNAQPGKSLPKFHLAACSDWYNKSGCYFPHNFSSDRMMFDLI